MRKLTLLVPILLSLMACAWIGRAPATQPTQAGHPAANPAAATFEASGSYSLTLPLISVPDASFPLDWQLIPQTSQETRDDLNVGISNEFPAISGSDHPYAQDFNQRVQAFISQSNADTLAGDTQRLDDPGGGISFRYTIPSAGGWVIPEYVYIRENASPLPAEQAVIQANHTILSVLFEHGMYLGGVHPSSFFYTLNYDFTSGKPLTLADLFQPGVNYLQSLADYAIQDLPARQPHLFDDYRERGAAPLAENYQAWILTRRGLLIVFGEYQVTPYAVGPQTVLIPYDVLTPILQPDGPLGNFARP